jgi:hypothetical protein
MEKPHKTLDVWQTPMTVAKKVYEATSIFPPEE